MVDADQMTAIVRQALFIAMEVSAPLLGIAMFVGFGISIFQSVTQINEMTLTFVPKVFIFGFALVLLFPWILKTLVKYTNEILLYDWGNVVSLANYSY